ncbi:BMP family protein [Tepidibacter hydrothermalis]|uniref:BMP family protein n=1 Tax=Tepidibacter hydrothermalis TaxID=3036126 RepID=A0ABY8E8Z1_9FIRM|nr:BMP family protein [Tepidibacter hydrothermalis]WFD09381.1 BMP family protein [Tepidibacter hydrothermalis]
MRKKILILMIVVSLVSTILMGCGKTDSSDSASDKLKVALLLPGKADDVSFNQAMYEGMKKVEEAYKDKIEVTYVEEVYEVSDIEPALRDFASEGYDLVFGHGFQFMEPIIKVAEDFPDVHFALGTGYKTLPNTCVYDIKLEEGGYLMGTLAGMMTNTNKIGVVGGADAVEIYRGHEAYKFAAKKVNPDVEIQELYTGDWRDAAKAKEGAISMYDGGTDIIWHSGDGIGLGVVDAGKEKGKTVLGNVADQNILAPDAVLSGVVYNFSTVIEQIIDDIQNDNFTNREEKFYWLTVANEGIKVGDFYEQEEDVPQEVKDQLEKVKKDLAEGKVKMPHFDK